MTSPAAPAGATAPNSAEMLKQRQSQLTPAKMPVEVIYKLNFPIRVDGVEYSEIRLHTPLVRDILAVSDIKADRERSIMLIALMARIPPTHVHELSEFDFLQLDQATLRFLDPDTATS